MLFFLHFCPVVISYFYYHLQNNAFFILSTTSLSSKPTKTQLSVFLVAYFSALLNHAKKACISSLNQLFDFCSRRHECHSEDAISCVELSFMVLYNVARTCVIRDGATLSATSQFLTAAGPVLQFSRCAMEGRSEGAGPSVPTLPSWLCQHNRA